MNVVFSGVGLLERESNVLPINEQVVMPKVVRQLQVMLERSATARLASVLVGIGLLICTCGCDLSTPVASTFSNISASGASTPARDSQTSPRVINLGDVSPGGQVRQWIEINNPRVHDVEIASVRVGCECVSVTLDATKIPAERSVRALVVADLSHLPDFRGGLGVSVTIHGSEGEEYHQFRVDLRVPEREIEVGNGCN
jgi:hypothetical protein